jgi:hypothetical protein
MSCGPIDSPLEGDPQNGIPRFDGHARALGGYGTKKQCEAVARDIIQHPTRRRSGRRAGDSEGLGRHRKNFLTHRMPCSGDIKAKRPIPLTTPQILQPLFRTADWYYRSCTRSRFRSCSCIAAYCLLAHVASWVWRGAIGSKYLAKGKSLPSITTIASSRQQLFLLRSGAAQLQHGGLLHQFESGANVRKQRLLPIFS